MSVSSSSASSSLHERGGPLELPSERLPVGWLPRVLNARDLTVLCLFSVLLVSNVTLIAGAGASAYLYWILGFVTFLIPSALICAQLYRLFPGEGAVYVWANKAFGSFWDTFLGFFCNWWPGALGLTIEAGAVVTSIQALNATWLSLPWQQGVVEILVLLLAQGLCQLGQRQVQRILNGVFFAYICLFGLLALAGLLWLLTGHHVQGDFSAQGWQVSPSNYPVFATVIVSLLGMAVPLNLGAEVTHPSAGGRYLRWGVIVTVIGYLIATFGVLAVLPPKDLGNPAFVAEILTLAFGPILGTALGFLCTVVLVVYFICATAAFNLIFARLLLVAGVDRRLPSALQRLSRRNVPVNAMRTQTALNLVFVAILFFVAPAFAPSNQQLSFVVFLVTINGASVIWNIAMIGLFLCGMLLCGRYRQQLQGKWVVPESVLYLAAALGMLSSGVAIYSTFFAGSPVQQTLSNSDWDYYVLLVVVGSLAVGAAYSFLVPEAEDIVALMKKADSPVAAPSEPLLDAHQVREEQRNSHGYNEYNPEPSPFFTSTPVTPGVPRGMPTPGYPGASSELFPGAAQYPRPGRSGDVPRRMG